METGAVEHGNLPMPENYNENECGVTNMIKTLTVLSCSIVLAACVVQPSGSTSPQAYPGNQAPAYNSNQAPAYQGNQQPAYGQGDALVAGTDYHATGSIPCSMGAGQPTGSCPFGVKREGNGSGMVTVTKPDGRTRTIFFSNGKATGYDQSQADSGAFSASKQSDLNMIRIGNERYEIPDGVIFGG